MCVVRSPSARMLPRAAAANNQWRLGEELVSELSQTSFRKALKLCEGAVSILDSGGVVFERAWRAHTRIQPSSLGVRLCGG